MTLPPVIVSAVRIEVIRFGSAEYDLEVVLRSEVLRKPLGLEFSADELARESTDIHLGAFEGERLVGCLFLSPQSAEVAGVAKVRQVAVAPDRHGRGVGKGLAAYAESTARDLGFRELILAARETAVTFYLALGYEIYGEPTTEVTLPHRKMRKILTRSAD